MSHPGDQRASLPGGQCILLPDTFPSPAPSKISEIPSRHSESKARASTRATQRKSKARDRVKPPANGFLLFRSEYVSIPAHRISGDGSRKRQVDLTRQAGVAWRRLSQAERDIYRDTARQNMEEHKAKHPDYWTSRRGKDGKYMRANPEREQGSSVNASHGVREAMTSVDPCSESTAAPSPSSDAPSPCPSLTSSTSDDDCPTPRPFSQQSSLPAVAMSSLEEPSLDGSQPYGSFSDFIRVDESQFLPEDSSLVLPSWFPEGSLSTDLCADLAASKVFTEPMYEVSYEDWAFVEGEEFFRDSAQALDDIAIPLTSFSTS